MVSGGQRDLLLDVLLQIAPQTSRTKFVNATIGRRPMMIDRVLQSLPDALLLRVMNGKLCEFCAGGVSVSVSSRRQRRMIMTLLVSDHERASA